MNITKVTLTIALVLFTSFIHAQVNMFDRPVTSEYVSTYVPSGTYELMMYQLQQQQQYENHRREQEKQMLKQMYRGEIHVYGGKSHEVYLGCVTCSPEDPLSIWNSSSEYGKNYSGTLSIWNSDCTFGYEYSDYSPWSRSANQPPVLVDFDGNFYGYFTRNYNHQKITYHEFCKYILENYSDIKANYKDFSNSLR